MRFPLSSPKQGRLSGARPGGKLGADAALAGDRPRGESYNFMIVPYLRSVLADWLLTDNAAARVVGTLMGLEAHGSLGVILWAAVAGHIARDRAFALVEKLAKSSLWISPRILDEARQALTNLSGRAEHEWAEAASPRQDRHRG